MSRPVSILPAFLKVLEKNIHKPVYGYLNNKLLCATFHSVFANNHSRIAAISQFVDDALTSFDQNKYTTGVFLDISKAFDIIYTQKNGYEWHTLTISDIV